MTHDGRGQVYLRMPDDEAKALQEWRKKSLMDKWRDLYRESNHDPIASGYANFMSIVLYWYTAVTECYVVMAYCVPFFFGDYGEMVVYYAKVLSAFIFISCSANWMCVRFYSSVYTTTDDMPYVRKSLWDEHPCQNGTGSPTTLNGHAQCEGDGRGALPWRWCEKCQLKVPYRAHHCIICRKCILKRDHHCYFSGRCVGFWNQRYFVIMNFYLTFASWLGFILICYYLYHNFKPLDYYDFFVPVTWFRYLLGWVQLHELFMISHLYLLWWTGFAAIGFFSWQILIIATGKTSHETFKSKAVRNTSSVSDNFRSVFGCFWGLNFLFPAQLVFRQDGDGTQWESLKITSTTPANKTR